MGPRPILGLFFEAPPAKGPTFFAMVSPAQRTWAWWALDRSMSLSQGNVLALGLGLLERTEAWAFTLVHFAKGCSDFNFFAN